MMYCVEFVQTCPLNSVWFKTTSYPANSINDIAKNKNTLTSLKTVPNTPPRNEKKTAINPKDRNVKNIPALISAITWFYSGFYMKLWLNVLRRKYELRMDLFLRSNAHRSQYSLGLFLHAIIDTGTPHILHGIQVNVNTHPSYISLIPLVNGLKFHVRISYKLFPTSYAKSTFTNVV